MSNLLEQLVRHEGIRLKPYRCTAGKLTIGVGRNLDDVGISKAEAMMLLETDVTTAMRECINAWPWFSFLTDTRQDVLVNMVFNMGVTRVKKFKLMLKALEHNEFKEAAVQMLDSAWAIQVGVRATELAAQMESGSYVARH